jgi:hypothetical protein
MKTLYAISLDTLMNNHLGYENIISKNDMDMYVFAYRRGVVKKFASWMWCFSRGIVPKKLLVNKNKKHNTIRKTIHKKNKKTIKRKK